MNKCRNCASANVVGVEYYWDHPDYYDGVSEWRCMDCEHRVGRWTNNTLKGDATEPKHGRRNPQPNE